MDDRYIGTLNQQKWDDLYGQLLAFVCKLSGRQAGDTIVDGYTPDDIVTLAIEKVWTGERKWDTKKYPDILLHLKWVSRSILSNIRHLKEKALLTGLIQLTPDGEELESEYKGEDLTPLDDLISQFGFKNVEAAALDILSDEPAFEPVFSHLVNETPPREIANELGLTSGQVYQMGRTVVRRLEKLKAVIISKEGGS